VQLTKGRAAPRLFQKASISRSQRRVGGSVAALTKPLMWASAARSNRTLAAKASTKSTNCSSGIARLTLAVLLCDSPSKSCPLTRNSNARRDRRGSTADQHPHPGPRDSDLELPEDGRSRLRTDVVGEREHRCPHRRAISIALIRPAGDLLNRCEGP